MSSAALHSTRGPREQNATGGQAASGTRSHRLEAGATLPRNVFLRHIENTNVGDESPRRRSDEFVVLNDIVAARSIIGLLRSNALDSLDALFRVNGGESLRKLGLGRWRERVRLTVRCDAGETEEPSPLTPLPGRERGIGEEPRAGACGSDEITLYLKRYTNPPRSASRTAVRAVPGARSLAGVEWHWLRRLAEDGIPAPRPVAMGEEIVRGREVRSVLVMTAVAGDALERILAERDALDARKIRRSVRPLAELVGKFHRLGYVHRDLYLSHVFHDATGVGGSEFSLIDVQRVMRPARPSTSRIVKDLASLNFSAPVGRVTRTERLRWFRWYVESIPISGVARASSPCTHRQDADATRSWDRFLAANAAPTSTRPDPPLVGEPPVAPACSVDGEEVGGAHPTRSARRLDATGRRLVYRILGKTLAIRRHQQRREARLAGGSGSP